MDYLEMEEVLSNSPIPVQKNSNLEGYAIVINIEESTSFISDRDSKVYIKHRCLIKWADLSEIEHNLTTEQKWNQRSLQGHKTHRNIVTFGANSWKEYFNKYGGEKEKNFTDRGDERALNDFNLIF